MGRRMVWILVSAFVLATGVELWADDKRPPRANEEFAAWPVDTAIEAEAECRLNAQSWRTSQEETATRFAREMLRLKNPKVTIVDSSGDDASASVRWDVLDVGIFMRQEYGCWYVTGARHREDFDSGDIGAYAGLPPNRVLFTVLPAGGTDGSPITGSLGSGFESIELEGIEPGEPARTITVPANADLPGHYIFVGFGYPSVGTIPAPPDPSSSVLVPPASTIKEMLRTHLGMREVGGCKRWWLGGEDPIRGALHFVWVAEPRGDGRRSHTDPVRAGKGDLRSTLDGVDVEFDFWRPTRGCSVLGRVTSRGDHPERVRSVRVDDDAFFFDLEWGRATHASLTYSYGPNEWASDAVPIRNPLSFNTYAPRDNTYGGYYFVTFYEDNRVLAVDGGALPPVEMIRDPHSPDFEPKERGGNRYFFGPDGPSRGYRFRRVEADYARGPNGEIVRDRAAVTFVVVWEYPTFPGRRRCFVEVFNGDGDPVGRRVIPSFKAREQGTNSVTLPITGKPRHASMTCKGNYKDERSDVVSVGGARVIPHGRRTTRLTVGARWMGPGEPPLLECLATFYDERHEVVFRSRFDLRAKKDGDLFGINLPNESPDLEDPQRALVTCKRKKPGAPDLPNAEPGVVVN